MTISFQNYQYSYQNERHKHVFVPSRKGYEVGYEIKEMIEKEHVFDDFFSHFRPGGHVSALHVHRKNAYFARIDLKNFFYSIARNRVARTLHECSFPKARLYAKWSCVKNPYSEPSYALPYGFVQSPILSTVVLQHSALGLYLKSIASAVTESVYIDDISVSSNDLPILESVFAEMIEKAREADFQINTTKFAKPSSSIELFNCDLKTDHTEVSAGRRAKFYAEKRTPASEAAFERYCEIIEEGNK